MSIFSKSKSTFFVIIIILALFLIFLNSKNVLNIPKDALSFCASPVEKIFKKTSDKTGNFLRFLGTIKDLNQENETLKKENKKLTSEITGLKEIVWENKLLREELNLSPRGDLKLTSSFIIGKSSPELGQYITIDKGRNSEIEKNQAVIASSGILVGKVIETSSKTSKIILITDINSSVSAIVQETRTDGIVKGEHGIGIIMEMIPRGEEIKSGETVITSGLEGFFPKGLLIGKIKEVILSPSSIFQKAIIEPAINIQELEMIFVVK
jgi:rod shape-determining protein MreC